MKEKHYYSEEEIKVISENYQTKSNKEIGAMIERSHWSVKHKLECMGLKRTKEERKAIMERCTTPTRFKSGNEPKNTLSDGDITIRVQKGNMTKFIRISKNVWKELQRHEWEKVNGKIPRGFVLACKNGDRMNCHPSNWEIISKSENLRRNQSHVDRAKLQEQIVASRLDPEYKKKSHRNKRLKWKRQQKKLIMQRNVMLVRLGQDIELDRKVMTELSWSKSFLNDTRKINIKPCNTNGKVPFRVDDRTIVYIDPDADREAIRRKYTVYSSQIA